MSSKTPIAKSFKKSQIRYPSHKDKTNINEIKTNTCLLCYYRGHPFIKWKKKKKRNSTSSDEFQTPIGKPLKKSKTPYPSQKYKQCVKIQKGLEEFVILRKSNTMAKQKRMKKWQKDKQRFTKHCTEN